MKMLKYVYILLIFLILLIFSGCVPDQHAPKEGVWYCDELKIQLSFEPGNISYIMVEDEIIRCTCENDKGSEYILLICSEENFEDFYLGELVFSAKIVSLNGSELVLHEESSGRDFLFIESK